jgi:general secretion pathway protein N
MIAALSPLLRDRRVRIGLLALFILALVATFPMRLAFALLDLDKSGISARDIRGSVWWSEIEGLRIANVDIDTVQAGVSPIQLMVGRARLNVSRQLGKPDDISGAIGVTANSFGIDDVTAILPLGGLLGPMPLSAVSLTDVSVLFANGLCAKAEGRVRADILGTLPGLSLAAGLSGDAACEGADLVLPLVSQSGMEVLTVRVTADGRYVARFTIKQPQPALAGALMASGFRSTPQGQVLTVTGSL